MDSLGAVSPIDVAFMRGRIDDELGKGKSHPCSHWQLNLEAVKGVSTQLWHAGCNVGAWPALDRNGVYEAPQLTRSYLGGKCLSTLNWTIPTVGVVGLPPRWTVDISAINETSLRNEVRQAAAQLKSDILLNIVEANQIWPTINTLARAMPAMERSWPVLRGALGYAAKRGLTLALRKYSGVYLAYKFGLAPILSDMYKLNSYLPKMAGDFGRYQRQESQRFTSLGKGVALYAPISASTLYSNGLKAVTEVSFGSVLKDPTVRYVLRVKPAVQFTSDFFKKLDFGLSRFATSPASLVWELTPFSFVVDWFVDMRGLCRFFDQMCGWKPYIVESFTRSQSWELQAEYFYDRHSVCSGALLGNSPNPTGSASYKYYSRTLVADTDYLPVFNNRFGKNQAAISAALIAQALSKRG